MIKFLTDENIAYAVISALRDKGYDIKDIKEERLFGISDEKVVKLANEEKRVILTCDKDFANLLRFPLCSHSGVILLRFSDLSPTNVIKSFLPLLNTSLAKESKILNSLVIVKDSYIEIIES